MQEHEEEFSFNGQRTGEKVVLLVRNHPFIFVWPGLKAIFFILLGIATLLYINSSASGFVLVIMLIIAAGILSRVIYDFISSVFVVTSERVICVDQNGFFDRKITETEKEKIQDVASKTKGMFKIMFKFGDLVIRTAGASKGEEIVVRNIPNPYEVQQKIASLIK